MEFLSVFLSRFGSQFKLPLPFVLGSLQARQHPFTESLSGLLRFFDPLGTGSLLGGVGGGLFLLSSSSIIRSLSSAISSSAFSMPRASLLCQHAAGSLDPGLDTLQEGSGVARRPGIARRPWHADMNPFDQPITEFETIRKTPIDYRHLNPPMSRLMSHGHADSRRKPLEINGNSLQHDAT